MKRARALLITAVACVALGGILGVSALAATTTATLSSKEYSLLSSAESKVGAIAGKKSVNWPDVLAICRSPGSSTTLLKTQSQACTAEIDLFQALANFPRDENKCGNTEPHKDLCLVPLYTGLANDATGFYKSAVAARKVAVQRGFTGSCLEALGDTPKQLAQQQDLAADTHKVANDVKLSAEIVEGKLPSSDINVAKVDADAKGFERYASLVLAQNSPKLSVCPHQ